MNDSTETETSEFDWLVFGSAENKGKTCGCVRKKTLRSGPKPCPHVLLADALTLRMKGRRSEALEKLVEISGQKADSETFGNELYWTGRALIHFLDCDLDAALDAVPKLKKCGGAPDSDRFRKMAAYLGARIFILRNELETARIRLEPLVDDLSALHSGIAVDALCMSAMVNELSGRCRKSAAAEKMLQDFCREDADPCSAAAASSFGARLALLRGDRRRVIYWLRTFDRLSGIPEVHWRFESPRLTECRALIAEGSGTSLREATVKLDACQRQTEALHRPCRLVDILCLSALAHEKLGFMDKARQLLARALTLAQRHGVVQPFAESGQRIIDMVKRLLTPDLCLTRSQNLQTSFAFAGSDEQNSINGRGKK